MQIKAEEISRIIKEEIADFETIVTASEKEALLQAF